MVNGPLAGFPIENLKVNLLDGSFHPVDSDQLSFEIAGRQAFKSAASKAKPVLLEPIMKVEIVTPDEYMGDIVSDLNRRRGQVESMDSKLGARVVKALVPLSEQFGYVTVLRTLSSGRATSSMEFAHYAEVPKNIALSVLENVKGRTDLL
jgi:elongation factor G